MPEKQRSWESFQLASQHSDFLALTARVTWDHESSMSLASRFTKEDSFFMLESATSGPGQIARYSFLGFGKVWQWSSIFNNSQIYKNSTQQEKTLKKNPLASMYEEFKKIRVNFLNAEDFRGPDLNSICGIVGYLAYDIAASIEARIGKISNKKLGLPEIHYVLPENYLIFDQLSQSLYLIHYCDVSDKKNLKKTFENGFKKLDQLEKKLISPHKLNQLKIKQDNICFEYFTGSLSKDNFLKKVAFCKEKISEGEIFQIQIGNRLSCKVTAEPFDIFRHLRMLNPSPYMFYYKFHDHIILGSSPEMMLNKTKNIITHRPIAGTRKRTWNKETDQRMRHELTNSLKERAEHVMLVDLSRNDIGKISDPGSVKLNSLMSVEEYSHVFHMVSEVTGQLQCHLNAADAMIASFPNGTVTGTPKIRAMELINQLEDCAREFYAGSLGIFTFNGDLNSTLLIRSIHIKDQIASTQASAGVVYDSIPEHEWEETRHKMAACLTAMQNTD